MADHLRDALGRRIASLRGQDPPQSLDDLTDASIEALVASALGTDAGWVGTRIQYPGFEAPRTARSTKAPRCSVVLAPHELATTAIDAGLFAGLHSSAEEAIWVEASIVREWHRCEPCARYAAAFKQHALRAVAQLATDERIVHARVAWVILASSEDRARSDLVAWERLAVQEGLPVGAPVVRALAMPDVQGNAACVTAIVPVQRL